MAYNKLFLSFRGKTPLKNKHFHPFFELRHSLRVGNEISTGILKRYALDKVTSFKLSKTCFRSVPDNLDSILQGSASIWFEEDMNLEVTVQIDASCSHYFKRRTMYPTQKIIEEREDGSIIVSFKVGRYEAIQNMLKSWIPHILILKPEGIKEAVLKDVKRWMEQQQGVAEYTGS